jgi:hypothetical protein
LLPRGEQDGSAGDLISFTTIRLFVIKNPMREQVTISRETCVIAVPFSCRISRPSTSTAWSGDRNPSRDGVPGPNACLHICTGHTASGRGCRAHATSREPTQTISLDSLNSAVTLSPAASRSTATGPAGVASRVPAAQLASSP